MKLSAGTTSTWQDGINLEMRGHRATKFGASGRPGAHGPCCTGPVFQRYSIPTIYGLNELQRREPAVRRMAVLRERVRMRTQSDTVTL